MLSRIAIKYQFRVPCLTVLQIYLQDFNEFQKNVVSEP
jgi:hypothetical protein